MTSQTDGSPDFELLPALDERPGPARRLPARRAQALIDGALAAAAVPVSPAGDRRRLLQLAVAAAVLLCLLGGAAAAVYLWRRAAPRPAPAAPIAASPGRPPAPTRDPVPVLAPVAAEVPAPVAPAPGPDAGARHAPRARAPEDLLRQANDRRRERRWLEADGLYQRVLRAHEGSGAAYVAQVASAALHLEQLGDPRGALRLYQGALRTRPGGSLDEEARHGVAESCRALSDRAGERRALEALLRAHPASPLRREVERRLRDTRRSGAMTWRLLLVVLLAGCTIEDRVAILPCAGCGAGRQAYCAGTGPPPLGEAERACGGRAAAARFRHALCACTGLGGDQPLRSDSFDGQAPGATGRRGDVATNGKLDGQGGLDIGGVLTVAGAEGVRAGSRLTAAALLSGGPLGGDGAAVEISGDATVGGDVHVASLQVGGTLTLPAGANINVIGAQSVAAVRRAAVAVPAPCPCAPADQLDVAALVAAARADNDDAELGLTADARADFTSDQRLDLPCGRYYLRRIQGSGGLTLRATGRVALYIEEGVTLDRELRIELSAGAELDLLVAGPLNLSGPLLVDSGGGPWRTRLYAGAAGAFNISGGARVELLLYAPLQDLAVSGGADLSGALLVRRVQHTGPLSLHHDEAAGRLGDRCP